MSQNGPTYIGDKDTKTHRICGTCGKLKPVSEFYKDGKSNTGETRYRRDCKDCYKQTRFTEDQMKKGCKKH